jgi:hypothetical protein
VSATVQRGKHGVRARLMYLLCWALRHPTEHIKYLGAGGTETICPCRHIRITNRPFAL